MHTGVRKVDELEAVIRTAYHIGWNEVPMKESVSVQLDDKIEDVDPR